MEINGMTGVEMVVLNERDPPARQRTTMQSDRPS
jgi:hypothetical protein